MRNAMKTISLALALALAVVTPACSRFTKAGRMDRAYYKQLKQVKKAREKRQKQLINRQRAEQPSLRSTPPPLQMQSGPMTPDSQ